MDIQFHGANCITISNKQTRLVFDDNLSNLGSKPVAKEGDVVFYTGTHDTPEAKVHLVIDQPGEYEVSEVSVYGVALRGHMDEEGKRSNTAYKLVIDDIRLLVVGHAYPELSERELEVIGTIDVMFVPVGGNGYTTDPVGALKLIKKIEPKLIIPTHYDDKSLAFPVPQQTLEQAIAALPMEPKETIDKLRLKSSDFGEGMQLVVVTKT